MNVLVVNSADLNDQAFGDPSLVTAGHIAAFNANGGILKIAHANAVTVSAMPEAFYFVRGGDTPMRTEILQKSKIKQVVKKNYVAPVKKVVTVSSFTTGISGAFGVRVHEVGPDGPGFRYNKSYEVNVAAADNAAGIATKVRDMILKDTASLVVPTVSGNDLVLTSKAFGNTFEVTVYGDGIGATVTLTTAPVNGSGSAAQVRELEVRAGFDRGWYTVQDGLMGEWPTGLGPFVDPAKNYNLYVIQHETNHFDNGAIGGPGFKYNETVIALATSGVTAANIDTFFGSLLVTK